MQGRQPNCKAVRVPYLKTGKAAIQLPTVLVNKRLELQSKSLSSTCAGSNQRRAAPQSMFLRNTFVGGKGGLPH